MFKRTYVITNRNRRRNGTFENEVAPVGRLYFLTADGDYDIAWVQPAANGE